MSLVLKYRWNIFLVTYGGILRPPLKKVYAPVWAIIFFIWKNTLSIKNSHIFIYFRGLTNPHPTPSSLNMLLSPSLQLIPEPKLWKRSGDSQFNIVHSYVLLFLEICTRTYSLFSEEIPSSEARKTLFHIA